jgi:hypothetical protein
LRVKKLGPGEIVPFGNIRRIKTTIAKNRFCVVTEVLSRKKIKIAYDKNRVLREVKIIDIEPQSSIEE